MVVVLLRGCLVVCRSPLRFVCCLSFVVRCVLFVHVRGSFFVDRTFVVVC